MEEEAALWPTHASRPDICSSLALRGRLGGGEEGGSGAGEGGADQKGKGKEELAAGSGRK
jgi:hypothetical protein